MYIHIYIYKHIYIHAANPLCEYTWWLKHVHTHTHSLSGAPYSLQILRKNLEVKGLLLSSSKCPGYE